MVEDDSPNGKLSQRSDAAERLAYEDLIPYSQDELARRIELLEAEIVRVRSHVDRASAHRAAADALFGRHRS